MIYANLQAIVVGIPLLKPDLSLVDHEIKPDGSELNLAIEKWQKKVERLGGEPQGLWIVDFDNGQGYFCWKFPEAKIGFWHGYEDGFSKRIALQKEETTNENCYCTNQLHPGGF